MSMQHNRIYLLAKTIINNKRKIINRCLCLDNCFDDSPSEEAFEAISWDIYNLDYGSPKTRSSKFHVINRMMPKIIEEMTVFERTELIKLVLRQQDRRTQLNMEPFSISEISLLTLQSEDTADEPGSHIADSQISATDGDLQVTVRYLDENPGSLVDFEAIRDNTFYSDYVPDSDIQKFLERPLIVNSTQWTEGSHLNISLAIWNDFFNSTQVKKKLDNFQWLSCNLNVKVVLNASPFYYSAALVSYQPLTTFTPSTINSTFANNSIYTLSPRSTRPHFWLYPQTNQGGEMRLPFIYPKNWLDINAATSFQQMGTLNIQSVTPLLNANAATGNSVTVTIFAWATDVRLSGPTIGLALQSDEYDGPVSGIASNVAKVSRSLERIPMIGPYAKATTMFSSGIAALAGLFGFTNVPVIDDVCPLKNVPFHAFASTEISTPIEKLSLDPKQELSIDNRLCGIGPDDEMIISNITQRDCLLNVATWTATNVAGDVIFKSNVCPYLTNITTSNSIPIVQGTPVSHVACLFKNWRGDMIYRFRFICSKFHRGRVIIQWDPNADIVATVPPSNLVYSQVVDISEETDVEFRVPYLQAAPWQVCTVADNPFSIPRLNVVNQGNGSSTLSNYENYSMNGRLVMRVLTNQTSPINSADIIVLTSIRSADNMEFANPFNPPQQTSFLGLQTEDLELQSELIEYNAPEQYCVSDLPIVIDENRYLVNFGEQIRSLRQLLRRVSFSRGQFFGIDTTSLSYLYYSFHAPIPPYRGYDTNGINSAKGTVVPGSNFGYTYASVTPINWLTPCYIGYRGGLNWHYNVESNVHVDHMRAYRYPFTQIVADYSGSTTVATGQTSSFRAKWFTDAYSPASTGQSLQNQKSQTGLSVYYPMYNRVRFFTTDPNSNILGTSQDESNKERCAFQANIKPSASSNTILNSSNVDMYCSIGTDFSLIFFLNVPSFYCYDTPTAN
jgi:hypothetical protein